MKTIGVIIPVYGEKEYTEQCLYSLIQAHNYSSCFDIRIGIVDNAYGNRILRTCEDCLLRVKEIAQMSSCLSEEKKINQMKMLNYIPSWQNELFSRAVCKGRHVLNNLYRYYNGPWNPIDAFLVLNNDTILPNDFFEKIKTSYFFETEEHDIYGPITNKCAGNQHDFSAYELVKNLVTIPYQYKENTEKISSANIGENLTEEVLWANGFCILIKEKLIEKIDFYDFENFPLSGEEIDFCYRSYLFSNKKAIIDRRNFVYHYKHVTAKKLEDSCKKYWQDSADLLRKKYPGLFPRQ